MIRLVRRSGSIRGFQNLKKVFATTYFGFENGTEVVFRPHRGCWLNKASRSGRRGRFDARGEGSDPL